MIARCAGLHAHQQAELASRALTEAGLAGTTQLELLEIAADAALERQLEGQRGVVAAGSFDRQITRTAEPLIAEAERQGRSLTTEEARSRAFEQLQAQAAAAFEPVPAGGDYWHETATAEDIADAATAREASIQRYWSYFGAEDAPQRLQDPQQADLALLGLVNANEQTMGRPVISLARLRHEVGQMWQADRRRRNPAGVGVQVVEWKPQP